MRVPEGFRLVDAGCFVRTGYEEQLPVWLDRGRSSVASTGLSGGRGATIRAPMGDGQEAFVRRYRHGGLLGRWLGEAYFDWPPRPWRELVATEAARRGGVLAPEILAAVVEPYPRSLLGVPYRGVLVSRGLSQRRSLGEALAGATGEARRAWIDLAVAAIRRLHSCGVRHPDLNVTNLLVGKTVDEPVAVIDFDRARVGVRPVGWFGRWMARRRLSRSLAKLGLEGLSRGQCRRAVDGILEGGGG